MTQLFSYVLSGGSGTRLWPFSREKYPKQFHDFTGSGMPLLCDTLIRLKPFGPLHIVTTKKLESGSEALLKRYQIKAGILAEPAPKNTAAAVLLGIKHYLLNHATGPGDVMGIFPADHVILKSDAFYQCVTRAVESAKNGEILTLGISPHYPATGYGYISVSGQNQKLEPLTVEKFLEKPSLEKAKVLLESGNAYWNAGIFIFHVQNMLEQFKRHLPEMVKAFELYDKDPKSLDSIYNSCQSVSLDVGIMEKVTSLKCIPADMGWTDLGSWEEIADFLGTQPQPSTFQIQGKGNFYSHVLNSNRPVVFVGTDDLIVSETPDALMITKRGSGQAVREAVKAIETCYPGTLKAHTFEDRPWGRFQVLMDTDHFKSKIICVLPAQRLSYQSHAKRAEHWTIVRGEAEVTLNDQVHHLKTGEHIFIPLGAKHRIYNPAKEVSDNILEFIEVQTGSYFGEDDIVRYSDDYGRGASSSV